jgi:hypothetical protein
MDGLIVAEKSISVSSIANGSSRLQPVVMTIGQAVGAAAALSIEQSIQPRDLSVREVQQQLLDAGAWLLPFMDTTPDDWFFQPLQRLGVSGVLKGEGIPYAWANQTKIYPDSVMTYSQVKEALDLANGDSVDISLPPSEVNLVSRDDVLFAIWKLAGTPQPEEEIELQGISTNRRSYSAWQFATQNGWTDDWITDHQLNPDDNILRKEFAVLVDRALDPFRNLPISIVSENTQK